MDATTGAGQCGVAGSCKYLVGADEHSTTHRTAPTKNYMVQNISTRSRKSWSGRAPKLGGGKPTMRIGRNFNFSLYSVWTIKVFF